MGYKSNMAGVVSYVRSLWWGAEDTRPDYRQAANYRHSDARRRSRASAPATMAAGHRGLGREGYCRSLLHSLSSLF